MVFSISSGLKQWLLENCWTEVDIAEKRIFGIKPKRKGIMTIERELKEKQNTKDKSFAKISRNAKKIRRKAGWKE